MSNPFEEIMAKLDAIHADVRALKNRQDKPSDDLGGLDLAVKITGLAHRTIYKLTHKRSIPHSRVGGRLYFKKSELEKWIADGRRKTVTEMADDVMTKK